MPPQGTRKREATGGRPTAGLPSRRLLSWSYTDLCIGVQRLALDLVHRLSAADLIYQIPNQPTIHPGFLLESRSIAIARRQVLHIDHVTMSVFPFEYGRCGYCDWGRYVLLRFNFAIVRVNDQCVMV